MALPAANLVKAALEQVYAVASDDKTKVGTRALVSDLTRMVGKLNRLYASKILADGASDILVSNTDAGVSEFIGGGEGDALSVGDLFRNLGAIDIVDGAFLTAKGSALVAGDVFCIDGADSVEYMCNRADDGEDLRPFDCFGETASDFMSIGS